MPIFNCPECQGKISNTVKQCIHCGAMITVCPECKTVYAEEITTCTVCGYHLKVYHTNPVNTSSKKVVRTASATRERWMQESSLRKIYESNAVSVVLSILGLLLCAVGLAKMMSWLNSPDLFTYEDSLSSIKTLFIAGIVLNFIKDTFKEDGKATLEILDYTTWSKSRGVVLRDVIDHTLSSKFEEMTDSDIKKERIALDKAIECEIYGTNGSKKNANLAYVIVMVAVSGIGHLFGYLFFAEILEKMFAAKLLESEALGIGGFDWSMIQNWWYAVVFVVFLVIDLIADSAINAARSKDRNAWIEENLPSKKDVYKNHIKNIDKYLTNRE